MKPHDVKILARVAWEQHNADAAFVVCREISDGDFYINYPTGYGYDPKVVTVKWGDKPCQSKCDRGFVAEGSRAWWLQGIGVWHLDCPTPEAVQEILDQRQQLPLPTENPA